MSATNRGSERQPLDAYYTPDDLAARLVGLLPIQPWDVCLEPHCGGGAFVRALAAKAGTVGAMDLDPNAPGLAFSDRRWRWPGTDFLLTTWPRRGLIRWVVGNPPYSGFELHVDHALSMSHDVVFLLRLAVLESQKRAPMWQRWPLRKVWVLSRRPSFTGGGTDSAAYGWFWFDRGWVGAPTLDWLWP